MPYRDFGTRTAVTNNKNCVFIFNETDASAKNLISISHQINRNRKRILTENQEITLPSRIQRTTTHKVLIQKKCLRISRHKHNLNVYLIIGAHRSPDGVPQSPTIYYGKHQNTHAWPSSKVTDFIINFSDSSVLAVDTNASQFVNNFLWYFAAVSEFYFTFFLTFKFKIESISHWQSSLSLWKYRIQLFDFRFRISERN